jgi:hypothetical protein
MRSRLLPLLAVLATFAAMGSVGATTVWASTPETTAYWYGCVKKAGGNYQNSECDQSAPPQEWEFEQLPQAERRNVTIAGVGDFDFWGEENTLEYHFECTEDHGKGWIENPTGSGAGTGYAELTLAGCKVLKPETYCKIAGSTISLKANTELVELEGETKDRYTLQSGQYIVLQSCHNQGLNGEDPVTGSFYGEIKNEESGQLLNTTPDELSWDHYSDRGQLGAQIHEELEGGGSVYAYTDRPTISTSSASKVQTTEATIDTTVNPNGSSGELTVEYGTTPSYGKDVSYPYSEGTSYREIALGLSPLSPNTTYHYRVTAKDRAGLVHSEEKTFTTPAYVQWSACRAQSGGHYASSTCLIPGSPSEWEIAPLKAGESTAITSVSTLSFKGEIAGAKLGLECEGEATSGSLENPSSRDGIGSIELKTKHCAVSGKGKTAEGCTATVSSSIPLGIELLSSEGQYGNLALKPKEGSLLAEFTFSGCKNAGLNGTYELTESAGLDGVINNDYSQLELGEAEIKSKLWFGGNPITSGTIRIGLATTGGGYISS